MKQRDPVKIPTRKISETILDFGEPLLSLLDETPPIEVMRKTLMIVVTVWNAHVLAMPIWKERQHLESLTRRLDGPGAMEDIRDTIDALTRRRKERFTDDPRAIGEWAVTLIDGEYRLRCDARLPDGATVKD